MRSKDVRKKFINFFEVNGHKIIPSSSLVPPEEDKSVVLTTAGMQQFKPYFLGLKNPIKDFGGKNLASSQKCLRTSDIKDVGDLSHLTFFEMLGNFSIGGYGKNEAIKYAWELLTSSNWCGLPRSKFFATVFAGDDQVPPDNQSTKMWNMVAPKIQVKQAGREDNFWPNPVWVGTCGPSTELNFKFDDKTHLEIWNLVFTQYYHHGQGKFEDLGTVNIDTGMGLERLVMILQQKPSVFETDLFWPIIQIIEKSLDISYSKQKYQAPIRIIADHIKAAAFLIKDGVIPSNKLQGYILRRLLRRAAVKIHSVSQKNILQVLPNIVDVVFDIYKDTAYFDPNDGEKIKKVISEELEKFQKTLRNGFKEVEKISQIDGKLAFDLYQSYGFPFEILEEIFREKGQTISKKEFDKQFQKHQQLSRSSRE